MNTVCENCGREACECGRLERVRDYKTYDYHGEIRLLHPGEKRLKARKRLLCPECRKLPQFNSGLDYQA